MAAGTVAQVRSVESLFIAFVDISPFTRAVRGLRDDAMADVVDECYSLFAGAAEASGGRIVKYLGDGALLVWPEDQADEAVRALMRLRDDTAATLRGRGVDAGLVVKAHAGPAVAGLFGPPGARQFDIIGEAVMIAARLEARTFSLSAAAFRKLRPETRKQFVRHTPPIVYLPAGHPRP